MKFKIKIKACAFFLSIGSYYYNKRTPNVMDNLAYIYK